MKPTALWSTRLLALLWMVTQSLGALAESRSWDTDILRETFGYGAHTPADQPLDRLTQGCPRRDCIPSIDAPRFVAADQASHIGAEDLVLGLSIDAVARAYPTAILNFHEIVNDSVAGQPVAVTFCPLCGSGTAVRRVVDGEVVEFGVSGLLFDSDLVMYDRSSASLWQQITGRAFVGPKRGTQLQSLPLAMTSWSEWRTAHPHSEVLLPPERPRADYARDPYQDYVARAELMFPVRANDLRVHPKTVVHGIELGPAAAAVSERLLRAERQLTQTVGARSLTWTLGEDGGVQVSVDGESLAAVPHRMFWFAWYTFHPHTELADRPDRATTPQD